MLKIKIYHRYVEGISAFRYIFMLSFMKFFLDSHWLCHKIWQKTDGNKKNNNSNSYLMENFFSSSSFKFSKIIWVRNNWESWAFCLKSYNYDNKDWKNNKNVMHRRKYKIRHIIWMNMYIANSRSLSPQMRHKSAR